ncbi:hypothetical protein PENSPDRAFT_650467 [Peniophora sp. CONT]|nr:hypothetical protein PENSPDRAFT_650467 [Peniophora sp. CONT]
MCDPSPTETQYATVVSTNVITTFSLQLLTIPAAATNVPFPTCVSVEGEACTGTTTILAATTLPDEVKTVTVPLLITELASEVSPTLTLYAPCSSTTSSDTLSSTSSSSSFQPVGGSNPTPSLVTPSATAPPSSSSTFTNSASSISTSTYMIVDHVTSAIGTALQGGSTIILYTTIVTSHPVTATTGSDPSGTNTSPDSQNSPSSRSSTPVAAIAGGTVGGFVGLIALVGLVAWVVHRFRKRADAVWSEEEANEKPAYRRRPSQPVSIEPKPYQYGIVGVPATTPPLTPPATSIGHSSAILLSRSASVTMDAMPDSTAGMPAQTHSYPSSPTPTTPMSRGGSPQQPATPGGYYFDRDFGARPTSAASQSSAPPWRERRTSRSSIAALSVHLPSSPQATDYFGILPGTTDTTPALAPPAADNASQLSSEPRRSLHVVN